MDTRSSIEVDFVIEGKNLDLGKLTEELGILPTETRGIDDWPDAIKNNSFLPQKLKPTCEWCISYKEDMCRQVDIPINKIIDRIKGKEKKIFEFCKTYNLNKALCIVIQADAVSLPEIVLSPYVLSFFGKLEAEIGFDIYAY